MKAVLCRFVLRNFLSFLFFFCCCCWLDSSNKRVTRVFTTLFCSMRPTRYELEHGF